jgi:hypothetical protein
VSDLLNWQRYGLPSHIGLSPEVELLKLKCFVKLIENIILIYKIISFKISPKMIQI